MGCEVLRHVLAYADTQQAYYEKGCYAKGHSEDGLKVCLQDESHL